MEGGKQDRMRTRAISQQNGIQMPDRPFPFPACRRNAPGLSTGMPENHSLAFQFADIAFGINGSPASRTGGRNSLTIHRIHDVPGGKHARYIRPR